VSTAPTVSVARSDPWRVFFVGGLISYRALFNWLRPAIYIPTMLGSPTFQIFFFAYVGRFSGLRNDAFFVVGNSVQACSMASIYGMTMALGNERYFGTLSSLLASPASRPALFLGRAAPLIANGLFISAFGFALGAVFLDFDLTAGMVPALALVLLITVVSCSAFGATLGSIGLRARDVFFISNLAYFLMLLLCGVNVPLTVLPGWLQSISHGLPLTNGIQAARIVAARGSLDGTGGFLLAEAVIGLAYGALGYALFRFFEHEGRRTGSLHNF
jgi:ABC-2 type transport system permease protein